MQEQVISCVKRLRGYLRLMSDLIKIMHIDDDPIVCTITAEALRETGLYEIGSFETAKEAIRRYVAFAPDLIMMDFVLPDMKAYDLAKRLESVATAQQKKVPIIIVSGNAEEDIAPDLKRINVLGYIKKPYTPDQITEQVKSFWDQFSQI